MSEAQGTTGAGSAETSSAEMQALLDGQRAAYLAEGVVSSATRIDRLERAVAVVTKNQQVLVDAMCEDFGHRSEYQSMLTDVAFAIGPLRHAQQNLKRWQKREKRKVNPGILALLGAKAWIEYQPLGVVGVISPWNFPVNMALTPLAGVLSAGNRCMLKPSEYTPATSAVLAAGFAEEFDQTEIAVITGGAQTGADFSGLAFDHLIFTGANTVAKHVMRAAADNLVPVTLELGGKSPVIVSSKAEMDSTTDSIMAGKTLNAGQICLAPDYVFVPRDRMDEFVESSKRSVAKMFPSLLDNPDYTSVINGKHFDRINGYVDDARERGVEVVELNPAGEDFRQQSAHKIPPTLLIDPPEDAVVMQEEIFGPVMPIKPYDNIDEAVDYVNSHDRPLGLYYFGYDSQETRKMLEQTTSGGVTLNDVVMHIGQEDLPFGGVGASGMGSYHGEDGFRTFSHAKAIFKQATFNPAEKLGLRPPYGEKLRSVLKSQIK